MTDTPARLVRLAQQLEDQHAPQHMTVLMREAAEELERYKQLDREAATYVESVICMKSNHFTAEPPYVGWKGLGLALQEDYAEIDRLRAALREIAKYRIEEGCPCSACEHSAIARAALGEKA